MTFRFVSNVDGTDFWEATHDLDPAETLFVVSSKTFTTLETLTNARSAREWSAGRPRRRRVGGGQALRGGVDERRPRSPKFGIDTANMFEFWDWVGGRYSYDSAIGLSLMIAIGHEQFAEMLAGFRCDRRALPHRAVRARTSRCCSASSASGTTTSSAPRRRRSCPYSQYLARFPAYLQQLDMESDGKSVDLERQPRHHADRPDRVGPARHQRPARVLPAHPPGHEARPRRLHRVRARQPRGRRPPGPAHRQPVRADRGARVREDRAEVEAEGVQPRYRNFAGNHPTNTILAERLTPYTLGQLVAIYEHKVFTQGTIWNINSFDQWGVELGKQLATAIIPELDRDTTEPDLAPRQQHQRAASAGTAGSGVETDEPTRRSSPGGARTSRSTTRCCAASCSTRPTSSRAIACGPGRPARAPTTTS